MSTTRPDTSSAPENTPTGLDATSRETEGQKAVRYVAPAVLAVAGLLAIAIGGGSLFAVAAGIMFFALAVLALVTDRLVRLTVSSEVDREREQTRRRRFSRTGRW